MIPFHPTARGCSQAASGSAQSRRSSRSSSSPWQGSKPYAKRATSPSRGLPARKKQKNFNRGQMPLPRGLFPRGEVPAQLSLKNRAADRRAASCESTGVGEEHSNIWLGANLISALQHPTAGANGCPTPPPTPLGTHLSLCLSPSLYSRSSARGWEDLRSSWFLHCKP